MSVWIHNLSFDNLIKNGNSNEKLLILNVNNEMRVVKDFRGDVERARRSVEKQRKFKEKCISKKRISAVEVLNVNAENSTLKISMPYVNGIIGSDYGIQGNVQVAETIRTLIDGVIEQEFIEARAQKIKKIVFIKKMNDVLMNSELSSKDKAFNQALDFINSFSDEISIPCGYCHGDLTLSNMIYESKNSVKLIDFLDSYLESPLQDIAKLIQEFRYGWSFRRLDDPLKIKAKIFLKNAEPKCIKYFERIFWPESKLVTLVNIFRIYPYIKDEITMKWVEGVINSVLNDSI